MSSNQKPVIDKNIPAQVEFRDGVKVVVFRTTEGVEVLFWRDRDGYVKRVVSIEVEAISLGEARNIAIKMLPNPFLEKDSHHSVKVVDEVRQSVLNRSARNQTQRPAWLDKRLAIHHDNQLSSHNSNDD